MKHDVTRAKTIAEVFDLAAKNGKSEFQISGRKKVITEFVMNNIVKIVPLKKDDVVLDIGFGNGALFQKIHDKVKILYGIDFENIVKRFKEKFKKYNNVIIKKGCSTKLSFKKEFFDVIIINSVMHYLSNKTRGRETVSEICRVLKKKVTHTLEKFPLLMKEKSEESQILLKS